MQITFTTPKNFKKLMAKEIKNKKLIFVLLQNFYLNLKSDVINSIKYNKKLNYKNYQLELEGILKFAYSSFISLYNYEFLNTSYNISKIQKNSDAIVIKNKIQSFIDNTIESINFNKNDFINALSQKQAFIIFDNIKDKIASLYTQAQNKTILEATEINEKLLKIEMDLQELQFLQNTKQVERTRQALKDKQENYLNKKTQYQNIAAVALSKFVSLYDSQIVKNRSLSQAENEINLISNKFRAKEIQFFKLTLQQENTNTVSEFKQWDATLDSRTRKTHAAANGQTLDINELFIVENPINGNLEYALEPMGEGLSIENTAKCRCKARYSVAFEL